MSSPIYVAIDTPDLERAKVDLERRELRCDEGGVLSFEIDDYTRWRLLEGLDDIGLTLRHADDIAAYEKNRASWLPVTA